MRKACPNPIPLVSETGPRVRPSFGTPASSSFSFVQMPARRGGAGLYLIQVNNFLDEALHRLTVDTDEVIRVVYGVFY